MKPNLRVVFMGTPEFSAHILKEIINADYEVVGVVSTPDKPAGRGQKIHSSAVTQYARDNDLYLMQPPKLKSKSFISELKSLQADVFVVVAFRMLPKVVWSIPPKGTFNLHASLLPQYRGAAPINWAIINGEKKSGITTFLIDEKIDTGNILLKKEVPILEEDNAGTLHDKLMYSGAGLVVKTLEGLENNTLKATPQKEKEILKEAPKLFKENTEINWSDSLIQIKNFIRGLNPYPAAWTYLLEGDNKKQLKIYNVEVEEVVHTNKLNTICLEKSKMGVYHAKGIVWLKEIQLQGKKKMDIKSFLNGFKPEKEVEVDSFRC